jgi:hypothetical protein
MLTKKLIVIALVSTAITVTLEKAGFFDAILRLLP